MEWAFIMCGEAGNAGKIILVLLTAGADLKGPRQFLLDNTHHNRRNTFRSGQVYGEKTNEIDHGS